MVIEWFEMQEGQRVVATLTICPRSRAARERRSTGSVAWQPSPKTAPFLLAASRRDCYAP